MKCQKCTKNSVKNGFYIRKNGGKRIQRFRCKDCRYSFSEQTGRFDYRLRLRRIDQISFRLLCSGVSQRRCSLILKVKPATIARRVCRFGIAAEENLAIYRHRREKISCITIDEMETFEHTKCKPLTIPIAVEDQTRKIISLDVGQIPAKGRLAEISRKKYGFRKCERSKVLEKVFSDLAQCCDSKVVVKSDKSSHYPRRISRHFSSAIHIPTKGRRGCVVGQGELKRGGWDPLFYLNHSYAMFRDNLKTLSRRTWCTAKIPKRLKLLLFMYAWFHNLYLEDKNRIIFSNLVPT